MGAFSIWHWIVVLAIVMVIFGPRKLGNLGHDLGKGLRELRNSMDEKNITQEGADNARK